MDTGNLGGPHSDVFWTFTLSINSQKFERKLFYFGPSRCISAMSLAKFIVTEHWSPCQLIREYPHGAKSDDAKLFLAVKQYRPRRTLNKEAGGVTLIATHGNGFPKV